MIHEWVGIRFLGGVCVGVESFADTLSRTGLGSEPLPNRRIEPDIASIKRLLPEAISETRSWIQRARNSFEAEINVKLDACLKELEQLRSRQKQQIEMQLSGTRLSDAHKAATRASREQSIDDIFDHYIQWVEETMTSEPEAYIQVISVLVAGGLHGNH